jgi:hypothetical protein
MKIKCGDVVFLPFFEEYERRFGEIGPEKHRLDELHTVYEVYPLKLTTEIGTFEYDTEPVSVNKKSIGEHYTIRNREDFMVAWTSLGFEPIVTDNRITFVRVFEHTFEPDSDCVKSLSSASSEEDDEEDELRSNDTYSTLFSESSMAEEDSFVEEDNITEEEEDSIEEDNITEEDPLKKPDICECSFCDTSSTTQWFDREWNPTSGSEEHHIKKLIENIEAKYT